MNASWWKKYGIQLSNWIWKAICFEATHSTSMLSGFHSSILKLNEKRTLTGVSENEKLLPLKSIRSNVIAYHAQFRRFHSRSNQSSPFRFKFDW